MCLCGFALFYKFKGPFLQRFHFCACHEIKSRRSHIAAVISFCALISGECVEVICPGMSSVAVVPLCTRCSRQMSKPAQLQDKVSELCMYITKIYVTASGQLRCPSVRAVPDGGGCAPAALQDAGGSPMEPVWPPGLTMAGLGWAGLPPTSSRTPAPAQPLWEWGLVKPQPGCAFICRGEGGLSLAPRVSAHHVTRLGFPSPSCLGCSFRGN